MQLHVQILRSLCVRSTVSRLRKASTLGLRSRTRNQHSRYAEEETMSSREVAFGEIRVRPIDVQVEGQNTVRPGGAVPKGTWRSDEGFAGGRASKGSIDVGV